MVKAEDESCTENKNVIINQEEVEKDKSWEEKKEEKRRGKVQ